MATSKNKRGLWKSKFAFCIQFIVVAIDMIENEMRKTKSEIREKKQKDIRH